MPALSSSLSAREQRQPCNDLTRRNTFRARNLCSSFPIGPWHQRPPQFHPVLKYRKRTTFPLTFVVLWLVSQFEHHIQILTLAPFRSGNIYDEEQVPRWHFKLSVVWSVYPEHIRIYRYVILIPFIHTSRSRKRNADDFRVAVHSLNPYDRMQTAKCPTGFETKSTFPIPRSGLGFELPRSI